VLSRVGLGLLLLVGVSAGDARAEVWTLPRLIERVRSDHPNVVAAREVIESAQAQLEWVNRQWAPRGELVTQIGGAPRVRCASTSLVDNAENMPGCVATQVVDQMRFAGPKATAADAQPVNGLMVSLRINLQQPLYTFGKIEAGREAARGGIQYNRAQLETAQADLETAAVRIYYTAKWAIAALATIEDECAFMRTWTERVRRVVDGGANTRYSLNDLKRMELGTEGYEQARLDIARSLKNAIAGLHELTGDPRAQVDAEPLEERAHPVSPLANFVDASRTQRVDIKMIDGGLRGLRGLARVRIAEMLPDLGISSGFGVGYASSVDVPKLAFAVVNPNGFGPSLSLGLVAPLGFAQKLAIFDQATAEARALELKRRYYLSAIAFDVSMAHAGAAAAEKKRALNEHAEKVARGLYALVDEQFALGLCEPLVLVDAARNYYDQRLRHLQAILDVEVADSALQRASGVTSPTAQLR
jgi:outer membrane protein